MAAAGWAEGAVEEAPLVEELRPDALGRRLGDHGVDRGAVHFAHGATGEEDVDCGSVVRDGVGDELVVRGGEGGLPRLGAVIRPQVDDQRCGPVGTDRTGGGGDAGARAPSGTHDFQSHVSSTLTVASVRE